MRYAIIADIHGNSHALKAVIKDAKKQRVDRYIFLGDYAICFPWGNEVVDIIRNIEPAYIIRGNGEDYLIESEIETTKGMLSEQLKPIYWAFNTLTKDNLSYLNALPTLKSITEGGIDIFLNHSMKEFYRTPSLKLFHTDSYNEIMMNNQLSHKEYLSLAREEVLSSSETVKDILNLPHGIYLYSHNHIQFNMEYEGRVFINPGSCGEALDWNSAASYTILEQECGRWAVIERKIACDIEKAIRELKNSEFSSYAPIWSKIMEYELMTGKDYFYTFDNHLAAIAKRQSQDEFPVSNEVWEIALKEWDIDKVYGKG